MTTSVQAPGLSESTAPRLLTRNLLLLCAADFGAMTSFYLLLSVVPSYAAASGGGDLGAGLTTGVMMLAAVVAETVTPRLAGRFGYRRSLVAGLALLGFPTVWLAVSASIGALVTVSLLRGIGFAIVVVATAGLAASLAPPERRGEGLGLLGVVANLPAVIALPTGVLLADAVGYPLALIIGAATAVLGVGAVVRLPDDRTDTGEPLGLSAALRTPSLSRLFVIFAVVAMAGGIVATFLPAAMVDRFGSSWVSAALLLQASAATFTRWWAGRWADRLCARLLVVPSVLVSAVGIAALMFASNPVAVLAAALIFGTGFGMAQSATLNAMFDQVSTSGFGTVSGLWNLAYDSGFGAGAIAFGVLAAQTGYPGAFGVTALVIVAVLPLTWTSRTRVGAPCLATC
jgi:predicted MFS family arabinose efflux permease